MGIYKQRTAFINEQISITTDQVTKRLLGVGYIPENLLPAYQDFMQIINTDTDTDLDKISNSNYFALNSNKVAGTVIPGTGFLNPIVVKGTIDDIVGIINLTLLKDFHHENGPAQETSETPAQQQTIAKQNVESIIEPANKQIEETTENMATETRYDRLKKIFSSLKQNEFGIYIPSAANSGDYFVKKAKAAGVNIEVVKTVNDGTDLYDTYITEVEKPTKLSDANDTLLKAAQQSGRVIIGRISPTNQDPKPEVAISSNDLQIIAKNNLLVDDVAAQKTQTIAQTVAKYNSAISDAELRAWVYYKRKFGNPMRGWEKYFMAGGTNNSILLQTTRDTTIKDNAYADLRTIPANTIIGAKTRFKNTYGTDTLVICKTPTGELVWINVADVKEIKHVTSEKQSDLDELVKAKALIFDGNEYYPYPVYLFGDIYSKIKQIAANKDGIVKLYGQAVYDEQFTLIKTYLPKIKSFRDPVRSNRPHILCLAEFANDPAIFGIIELNEESGIKLGYTKRGRFQEQDEKISLFDAFEQWMDEFVKDIDLTGTTKADIKKYYFAKSISWPKGSDGKDIYSNTQKEEFVGNARLAAENLFSDFLATALTFEDTTVLDAIWNEKYNAFTSVIQFVDKVPIGFNGSTMFKNGELGVKPAQRQGLAYLQLTGSGCLAYDVGFGKTLTGILNVAQLVSQGVVKRPLIVVPKPTYKNWLKELFGYWTDGERVDFKEFKNSIYHYGVFSGMPVKINDWYNLSGNHYKKLLADNGGSLDKIIPENTITVVSYKGFEQMGFSSNVSDQMFDSIARVVMQKDVNEEPKSAKKEAKETVTFYQKMQGWLGIGNKNAVVNVDTCGFDHLTVDEAHNFKNVFPSCGKDKTTGRKLFGITSGQSTRAIKMFFITNYIQAKHGKNVVLLTATPFTNSPLEIYSMLSFVGLETLNQYNLYNIKKFFEQFVLQTIEYAIDAKGEITTKAVIKSFENLKLLQTILFNHFHYKDDPKEANVVRPCKIDLPNQDITTYLEMNEWQRKNQGEVKIMAKTVSRDNPGAVLKAINMSLNNAFSPYLFDHSIPETANDFVENSPKIKFAIECTRTIKQWHEDRGEDCSGIIFYSNRGKEYFEYIKQYMIENLGFKSKISYDDDVLSEVEIISGGGSEADDDRKELVKDAFNAGIVKVIIGTATIREGVNLQARSANLFDLYPEWNPTDVYQLKGRIWRQGNMYGYIRFIMPLVINSMDNFINQKLDEKSKRIANLWKPIGDLNKLENTSDLDPAEIKYALVDDANEKFKMKHETTKAELGRNLLVLQENNKMLAGISTSIEDLKYAEDKLFVEQKEKEPTLLEYLAYLKGIDLKKLADKESSKTVSDINRVIKNLNELIEEWNKYKANRYEISILLSMLRMMRQRDFKVFTTLSDYGLEIDAKIHTIVRYSTFNFSKYYYDQLVQHYSEIKKAEKSVLNAYGKSWLDDITDITDDVLKKIDEVKIVIEQVESADYKTEQMAIIEAEMETAKNVRGNLTDQVNRFASLNHTLSYLSDNTDKETCPIPTEPCCATVGITVVHADKEIKTPVAEVISTPSKNKADNDIEKPIPFSKAALVFVPTSQVAAAKSWEYNDAKTRINEAAASIPNYGGGTDDKTVYFHYFRGGSDYFVMETDFNSDYTNIFGYAILNGDYQNAELGSESLDNLKKYFELDFYFEPKPLKEALADAGHPKYAKFKTKPAAAPITFTKKDYQNSLSGAKVMHDLATGKDKKDWKAYIDGLKVMIELM